MISSVSVTPAGTVWIISVIVCLQVSAKPSGVDIEVMVVPVGREDAEIGLDM